MGGSVERALNPKFQQIFVWHSHKIAHFVLNNLNPPPPPPPPYHYERDRREWLQSYSSMQCDTVIINLYDSVNYYNGPTDLQCTVFVQCKCTCMWYLDFQIDNVHELFPVVILIIHRFLNVKFASNSPNLEIITWYQILYSRFVSQSIHTAACYVDIGRVWFSWIAGPHIPSETRTAFPRNLLRILLCVL